MHACMHAAKEQHAVSCHQERKSAVDPMPPRGWWCAGLLSMAWHTVVLCYKVGTSNAPLRSRHSQCVRWAHVDRDVRRARACACVRSVFEVVSSTCSGAYDRARAGAGWSGDRMCGFKRWPGRAREERRRRRKGSSTAPGGEIQGMCELGDLWCTIALRGSGLRKRGHIHCSDGMGRFGDRRRAHSLTVHACMHAVQVRDCEGGG
jgi:hypothetical protein